jgi:hypothetical protein
MKIYDTILHEAINFIDYIFLMTETVNISETSAINFIDYINLINEAVNNYETSVCYETTWNNIPRGY